MNLEVLERKIIMFMQENENLMAISMPVLSMRLSDIPESRLHGRQHFVSQAIVRLRERGLLMDVAGRCDTCGRAPRPREEVRLYLTEAGRLMKPADPLPGVSLKRQLQAAERTVHNLKQLLKDTER